MLRSALINFAMSRIVRAAMTETKNVAEIPEEIDAQAIESIRQANVQHNISLIRKAAEQGAQIVCLGELFAMPYFAYKSEYDERWREAAESVETGKTVQELCAVARELSLVVIAPIYEVAEDGHYNTAVVIDQGEVLGKYRKNHIPHGGNEKGPFTEGFYYGRSDNGEMNAGREKVVGDAMFPVFITSVGKVGVSICNDRHFEYECRMLANGGAEIVVSPAITFGEVSERAWEVEFPADALRNDIFVGGSNRKGREFADGPEFFGRSYFVGPDCKRLESVSESGELVIADVDLELIGQDLAGWRLKEQRMEGY